MRNLKKVLVLVLCLAMMASIMVTGAAAAFTDQKDIDTKHQEAVDACVALSIINGYPDGSFKPNDFITRAEMTKMMCVMLNGGKEPTLGTASTPFTDVPDSHWASAYVKALYNQGVVAGKSATSFDPAGQVTGVEEAKMLLVALGYDQDKAHYVGNDWQIFVNANASAKGFYASLEDIDPQAPIAREHAAEMIWNALNAYEVEYKSVLETDSNGQLTSSTKVQDRVVGTTNDKITMLEDMYDVKAINGVLNGVDKDTGKNTYTISLQDATWNGATYMRGNPSWSDVTVDYSNLLYNTVRVMVREDNNGKDAVVFGVYPTAKNTVQTGILKQLKMDGNRVKLDGVKYNLDANTSVYVNGVLVDDATIDTIPEWVNTYGDGSATKYTDKAYLQPTAVELIANDGTTNYSILKVTTYDVGKVTAIGSDYVNVSWKNGDNSFTEAKCTDDDWHWYSGIAKNDYVIATSGDNYADGMGVIEKANVVSGKVTSVKAGDSVSLGNGWYTMAGKGASMVKLPNTGSSVDMVVVGDYVYYTTTTAGNIDDVALLVAAAPTGGTGGKWEGRLIMTDGSDRTVTIQKYWDDKDNKNFPITEFYEGNTANPNMSFIPGAMTANNGKAAPMLVTFSVSGDVYTLSRLGMNEIVDNDRLNQNGEYATNGYDYYVTGGVGAATDGSIKNALTTSPLATNDGTGASNIARLYYEDTGVVFVKNKALADGSDADYKVVSGKTAAGYDKTLGGIGVIGLADGSGNNYYMQVGMIDLNQAKSGGSGDIYAVVLDDVVKDTSNGTMYILSVWDGSGAEPITIKTDNGAVRNLGAGDIIAYSGDVNNADVEVKNAGNYYVKSYDASSGDITLADGDHNIVASTATLNKDSIDKDTVILYVSSDDGEGVTSGEIERAFYFNDDYWNNGVLTEADAPNVTCFFDDDDYITLIVVDINRNITEW